ncbi:hypothetical protein Tco_0931443, partial [Tanacetum coccineum]
MTNPNYVQTDYDATTHGPINNVEFKIGDEFLKILRDNSFNGTDGVDVINHTAKVLEILEWIKIPNVDQNQLRLHVFLISLSGDAKEWWNNEMDAGSRDRPPMLATGRYAQWRSRFLRYIDTRPNCDALKKCILEGPYTPTTVVIPAVP